MLTGKLNKQPLWLPERPAGNDHYFAGAKFGQGQ